MMAARPGPRPTKRAPPAVAQVRPLPSTSRSACRASSSRPGASAATALARHPRPPPGRARRELLAVPPLRHRRGRAAHRLAPLGPRRPSLRARARMGGRAHGLALDRPLALDGLCLVLAQAPKIERALVLGLALGRRPRRGGERVGLLGLTHRSPRADRRDSSPRPSLPTAVASTPTCRPGRPLATARRGGADQRLPLAPSHEIAASSRASRHGAPAAISC